MFDYLGLAYRDSDLMNMIVLPAVHLVASFPGFLHVHLQLLIAFCILQPPWQRSALHWHSNTTVDVLTSSVCICMSEGPIESGPQDLAGW